jgi:hypothetical protein
MPRHLLSPAQSHPLSSTLIVVDAAVPDALRLLADTDGPVLHLQPGDDALSLISAALHDAAIDTVHWVAHGRPGAVSLGGRWIDAPALLDAAAALQRWPVRRMALWSCSVGRDSAFVHTLAQLTGAEVLAADTPLGMLDTGPSWQLHAPLPGGSRLHGRSVFGERATREWPHRLGWITVSFASGFVGWNTANNEASMVSSFGDLGWTQVQFAQNSTGNTFTEQGNDITGSVLITDDNGVQHQINGFVKWRTPSGNSPSTLVFQPASGTNEALASDPSGAWGLPSYAIDTQMYIGLTFNGRTLSFNEGDNINGNAATSGLLESLNNYLLAQPQLSVADISVNEGDASATFTVTLSSASSDTVTVSYATSNGSASAGSDYTATSGTLSFLPGQTSKTVTVTLLEDVGSESSETFDLVLSNPSLAAVSDATGVATITDNDSVAGTLVTTAASGHTTEAGQTATFSVRLSAQPAASVTVNVTSGDTGEGTLSVSSLSFTTANWNTPQTVTVTGADDAAVDGNQSYAISLASSSTDANFNGLSGSVSVVNDDNDSAGLTVGTISRHTTEAGQTATFTVRLSSQPSAPVTVTVTSNDTGEGTVSTSSLTFTSANWNTPQTVTVTGVDDSTVDGNTGYTVGLSAASTDADYQGRTSSVSVVNDDNDSATLVLGAVSRHTSEAGQTATFSVRLGSQPSANVSVAVASDDSGEGTAGPATLSFTSANWNTPQTVTVTGADDDGIDGDQAYGVDLLASSGDASYDALTGRVSVVNDDDDTAQLVTTAAVGHTSEAGGTTSFTVRLSSQPAGNVTVAVASSDSGEGTLGPATLTFTPADWATPQTVTATGVDDPTTDGAATYHAQLVASSTDGHFDGLSTSVGLVNDDDDTSGLTISKASVSTGEDGVSDSFTVALGSQPTADVTLTVASTDTGEGLATPATLVFTPATWNTPQTVSVAGVDDADIDGSQGYFVTLDAASADTAYDGTSGAVAATNADDDSASLVLSGGPLATSESGASASFGVRLSSLPGANVTVTLTSTRPGEALPAVQTLSFTPANWNTPQNVTVQGQDDMLVDGDRSFAITLATTSADSHFHGLTDSVAGSNGDNDAAGLVLGDTLLRTGEDGRSASTTVRLGSQPSSNVTLTLQSGDSGEGRLSTTSLVFTATDWNQPRTITVTGVDDTLVDGTVRYPVDLSTRSADPHYQDLHDQLQVDNEDNDRPALMVDHSRLTTGEDGRSDTLGVSLSSAPRAPVQVTVASSNEQEGRPETAVLSFTADNWNVPQSVRVAGVDDTVVDGSQAYRVDLRSVSADPAYASLTARVEAVNLDDDRAGLVLLDGATPATAEDGSGGTLAVRLASRPLAPVTLTLSSSDGSEGRPGTTTLSFTPDNWDRAQTVALQGVDDDLVDGPVTWQLQGRTSSTDPAYNGLQAAVPVVNSDDDTVSHDTQPGVDLGGDNTAQPGDTARLLDPSGHVLTSTQVSVEQAREGSIVVQPPSLDDGTYTFMAQVLDADGRLRSERPITITIVTDRDGVQPSVESAAQGGDGNGDSVPDWQQNNVTHLPLRSLADFQSGHLAAPDSFGVVLAGTPGLNGAPVQLDSGAQLLDLAVNGLPSPLPAGLQAVGGTLQMAVTSQGGLQWTDASADAGHQAVLTIELPFGTEADDVLLWNAATGGWMPALAPRGAAPLAGQGGGAAGALSGADQAQLLDTNHDGRADRVVLTLTDGAPGDADGMADGRIDVQLQLALRTAEPVFSVLLANGDRYLSASAADTAARAQLPGARFEGAWFDSLQATAGGQPQAAWHQPFTQDWTWAAAGQALPYACYLPATAAAGFMAAPAASDIGTAVHLYLDSHGRTQLLPVAAATQLGLSAAGYRDLGAAMRSTTDTAFTFDAEGYLVANHDNADVQALVQTLAARHASAADASFVDAVELHYLTQGVLMGLPHGDAADAAALNAVFGTHFGG